MFKNRPYQDAQLEASEAAYNRGVTRQVILAAPGTGKSHFIANMPVRMSKYLNGQSLVIVHREELINQDIEKLRIVNPDLHISKEKAEEYADPNADILVASIASIGRLNSKRADRFNWDRIDKIQTDECQHSPATTYMNIYEKAGVLNPNTKKLHIGLTATATGRVDGKALNKVFQEIVHTYSLRDAIQDGWLVDIKGIKVNTESVLDEVKVSGGDFQIDSLAEVVNNPRRNQLAVKAWQQYGENRQTVAFTVDIQHAVDAAAMFNHYGVPSEAIWGNDPKRAEKLTAYRNGDFKCLFNCGILIEGYDNWRIGCILHMCPTKSSIKYIQTTGRGTRLQEGTGNLLIANEGWTNLDSPLKRDCIVIDLCDLSSKHSLITLPTLFGLNAKLNLQGTSLVGATRAIEAAQERYSHIDFSTLDDITKLEAYIESVDLFNIHYPEEVESNSELTWNHAVGGGYVLLLPTKGEKVQIKQNLLDMWEVSASISGRRYRGQREALGEAFRVADDLIHAQAPDALKIVKREGERWHNDPVTPKQLKTLAKLFGGKQLPKNLTKGEASKIIGNMFSSKA
jgi:superfamily II DNA or RNA helicase